MSKARGLDSWKDIATPTQVQKEHSRNEDARQKDRSLSERLHKAYEIHQKGKSNLKSTEGVVRDKGKAESSLGAEKLGRGKTDVKAEAAKLQTLPAETIVKQPIKTKSDGIVADNVYRNVPAASPAPKNPLQARAESQFVTHVQQPTLTDLLSKRSNVPPSPPTASEKERQIQKEAKLESLVLKELPDAKVKGPIASDAGAKLADSSKKEESGIDKKDRKKAKEKEGEGKTASTHNARRTTHDEEIGAGSGGVASGGEETVWLADLEPGFEIFNPEKKIDESLGLVLREWTLLKRHVYKVFGDSQKAQEAEGILQSAVALNDDPELNRILKKGLAARKNVYGGTVG